MFTITDLSLPAGKTAQLMQTKPSLSLLPTLNSTMGPVGSAYTLRVNGLGTLTLTDVGDTMHGPATWGVKVNDSYWYYEGAGGQMHITIDSSGKCSIGGGAGTVTAQLTLDAPPYVPSPGSIAAESTLMQNHKAAAVLPPQSSFTSLQATSGNTLFLAISDAGVFQLVREQTDHQTGWTALDISTELAALLQVPSVKAKTFSAVQNHDTGNIDIALAVTLPSGSDVLCMLNNLPQTDGAAWMTAGGSNRNWNTRPYDDAAHPLATVSIANVFLPPQQDDITDARLICEVVTGNNFLQNYTVNFTGGSAWAQLQTSENFDKLLSQCIGKAPTAMFEGTYQLTSINGGLSINYVPLQSAFGPPTVIKMAAPAGATLMAALRTGDSDGSTNLYVAATGGIYLYTPAQQVNFGTGTLICATSLVTGVLDFFAYQTDQFVTVWGLNQQGEVFYSKCPKGQEATPSAWSVPVPIFFNASRVSAYIDQKTGGITSFAHTTEQQLVVISQDPISSLWQNSSILLPPPDYKAMIDYHAYSTHIVVNDTKGFPMANAQVAITALTNCTAFINDVYHILSPDVPVMIDTDASGNIAIVQQTDNISAICYSLKATGAAPLAVNPMTKAVNQKFAPLTSTTALMNATLPDSGGKKLVDPNLPTDKQQATVDALQQFVQVAAKLPADGSVVKPSGTNARAAATPFMATPDTVWGVVYGDGKWDYHDGDQAHEHLMSRLYQNSGGTVAARGATAALGAPEGLGSILGDIWNWLKKAFKDVTSFFIKVVDGVYHFFVELAGTFYRAVLNCLADILHGIEFVFNKIAVAFEDLIKFIGFLFNWGDIVRTHKVLKNVCVQYTGKIVSNIGGYKQTVKDQFTALIQSIDAWAGIADNIPASLQGQTGTSMQTSQPGVQGSDTPEYNYGSYQTKSNVSGASTSATVHLDDGPATLFDAFEQALEREKDILGALYVSLKTEVIDKIRDLTIAQIFTKIAAILADAVLESVENILLALLDVLQVLIQGVLDLLTAPIEIPVLSPLYKLISGGDDLSLLDLACLVMAIPVTLGAKLLSGQTPFPDDATTTALINATSFDQIRAIVNGTQTPRLAASANRAMVAAVDPQVNKNLILAGGIMSVVGAFFLSIIGPLKQKFKNVPGVITVLEYANTFFYFPYVFSDIASQVPDLQNKKWWAIWNEFMADITTAIVLVDLVMARKSGVWGKASWNNASPNIIALCNAVWIVPTVAPIFDPENQNDAGALSVIGGIFFDASGVLTLPIATEKDPESLAGLFIANGVVNGVYGISNLASSIITYKS